ncbi:predicted protein [Uncinocarpus reesii 1704]|uniref:Aminoglycoside phosphotransferase domain-containing protein n=1 Tax=Uncinocarpus reesii (strain UAMH 1704) TaxID=336963 RepID=C4JRJ6_UNCRE|nr:uncharacterized protein UREG_05085 [Uncinocarpus reesii 1704]EEP80243.1 predicted protein [Uncinocarpus reesii 1704]
MTVFDELAETNGDNEWKDWLSKILDLKIEIATFVASRCRRGQVTEIVGYLKGSFNLGLHVRFDAGPDAVIRFPKPGHTAFRDEKVANEVRFMQYLSETTPIPVPQVINWGRTEESPYQLGPFIIMDYIRGTRLSTVLKQPTQSKDEDVILSPNVDNAMLDKVYDQIASFLLQLYQSNFNLIGAITRDPVLKTWSVTSRPLTYNMNELATVAFYPTDKFPTEPFASARAYFQDLADEHTTHLWTQRNLATDPEDAWKRYVARHRFEQLIPKYCTDDAGPYTLFCDDLQPSNMLIDEETLEITAVLDSESTNVTPAQFAYDPPWWLLLLGPDMWLERYTMAEFLARYEPRMEQFLQALERVEGGPRFGGEQPLALMRESWATGRFWFNYAARTSFDIDAVYWAALSERDPAGTELLHDKEARELMRPFTEMKMEQLTAYKKECTAYFS